jgi:hypothetical protein
MVGCFENGDESSGSSAMELKCYGIGTVIC